jgi:hypothetical protein
MELTAYLARRKEIASEISEHKSAISSLLSEKSSMVMDSITEFEANRLYWETNIPVRVLISALGVVPKKSWNKLFFVELLKFTAKCPSCGGKFERYAATRSRKQEREDCADCSRKREEERVAFFKKVDSDRGDLKELQTMPYSDYLKTDHWKFTRRDKLNRVRYRCELCDMGGVKLHVHHRHYRTRGCEAPWDLTVLCEKCHAKFHDKEASQ